VPAVAFAALDEVKAGGIGRQGVASQLAFAAALGIADFDGLLDGGGIDFSGTSINLNHSAVDAVRSGVRLALGVGIAQGDCVPGATVVVLDGVLVVGEGSAPQPLLLGRGIGRT
jgi:hypothetical protein